MRPEFDAFFRDTFVPVARAAALVSRDFGVGQEVAQEAFARLYERWPRIESAEHARRFAYRVAINLARSHLRKHLRVTLSGLDPSPRVQRTQPGVDEWVSLRDALGKISPRQRAVVVLIDYVGMDAAEAAEILRIASGTVRAHLMRGRRALRRSLALPPEEVAP